MIQVATHRPLLLILAVAAICPAVTAAGPEDVNVTLRSSQWPQNPPGPYAWANLEIRNNSELPFNRAQLRWDQGGPTYRIAMTVAPRSTANQQLLLPAAWAQQSFTVTLTASDGRQQEHAAVLAWPEDVRADAPFIDQQVYDPYESDLPRWPESLRSQLLAAFALAGLALAGSIFLSRARTRIALAAAVLVGLSLYLGLGLLRRDDIQSPVVVRQAEYEDFRGRKRRIVILTTRRSSTFSRGELLLPLYRNFGQVRQDRTVIDWPAGVSVPIQPDQLRIFQQVNPPD
ncbi:MAG: hypothetical protein ACLFUJ_06320 [Phycisphaerae bacterium]